MGPVEERMNDDPAVVGGLQPVGPEEGKLLPLLVTGADRKAPGGEAVDLSLRHRAEAASSR